nr:MAK10-like protein [Tanacetum cinerariifolium]
MRDANPIRTLGDYFKPSLEGYRNTTEFLVRNNVVPLQSDTIQLVQNGCSFYELRSEDPNQHLKIHHHMGGSYYLFPCLILSIEKDRKTLQRYPDVPTTSRRISLRSMDSFQGLTLKSPSTWHRSLAPSPNLL